MGLPGENYIGSRLISIVQWRKGDGMKSKSILIVVLTGLILLMSTACSGGNSSDYRIEFTVDGSTHYVFREAYGDSSEVALGAYRSSDSATYMLAETDADGEWVMLKVSGSSAGSYEDSAGDRLFKFYSGSVNSHEDNTTQAGDFTITITRYSVIGGVIEGTFSGTSEEYTIGMTGTTYTGTTHEITDGSFTVLHAQEDEISDFFR